MLTLGVSPRRLGRFAPARARSRRFGVARGNARLYIGDALPSMGLHRPQGKMKMAIMAETAHGNELLTIIFSSANDHPRLALRSRLGLANEFADHPGNVTLAEKHEIQIGHEGPLVGPAEMDLRRFADAG